jgi:hypothetical protein
MPDASRAVRAAVLASLDPGDPTHQLCSAELEAGAEVLLMSGLQTIQAALGQELLRAAAMRDAGVPSFGVERFVQSLVDLGAGRLLMGYLFGKNHDCHLALSWPDHDVIGVWAVPHDRPMQPADLATGDIAP